MDLLTLLLGATLTSLLSLAPFILPFVAILIYFTIEAAVDHVRSRFSRNDANRH